MARYGYGGGYGGGRPVLDIGLGGGEPPSRDLLGLLIALFVTYTLGWLPFSAPLIERLHLSPDVWQRGFLWQLVTYAFVPEAGPIWFLVGMLILYMFGRDVHRVLGPRRFWQMLAWTVPVASIVAVLTQLVAGAMGHAPRPPLEPFAILRGDEVLLTILIAAFATLYPNAVIRLFFILPIRAGSFLWLEILLAFVVGFLPTLDLAGFVGICAAVGATWVYLHGGQRGLREIRLRIEKKLIEMRLRRMRNKRNIRIVRPDEGGDARRGPGGDPWVH